VPGRAGADAPVIPLREFSFFRGSGLTLFYLCCLWLFMPLLCGSYTSDVLSLKCKRINCLMAPSGSPGRPGSQPDCANRQVGKLRRIAKIAFRACGLGLMTNSIIKVTIINAKRIMLFSSELFGVFMAVQMAALSDQQTLDIHLSTIFY